MGATGPTGTGATGATGPQGPAGSGLVFLSSFGMGGSGPDAASLATTNGAAANAAVMPLSGHLSTAIVVQMIGGAPSFASARPGVIQTLPAPVTFTKMYGNLSIENTTPLFLTNTLVTLTAQLYKWDQVHDTATAMTGATCVFQDGNNPGIGRFTFLDTLFGNVGNCSATGFSAPFNAGDSAFMLLTATATSQGPGSNTTVSPIVIGASIGLSQ